MVSLDAHSNRSHVMVAVRLGKQQSLSNSSSSLGQVLRTCCKHCRADPLSLGRLLYSAWGAMAALQYSMSRAEQQPTANVVQAAAKLAFASSAAKQRVANQLVLVCKQSRHSIETVQMSLETAAQAAWLQPKVLLSQLKGDPCFRVVQGAGSASGYFVGLNVARLISKGKSKTTTGILTEELPPPKGFVDGKHPIRTGGCQ